MDSLNNIEFPVYRVNAGQTHYWKLLSRTEFVKVVRMEHLKTVEHSDSGVEFSLLSDLIDCRAGFKECDYLEFDRFAVKVLMDLLKKS